MKYLEAILGFLTTIARIIFRGKGKHKPDRPAIDNAGNSSDEHGSGAGNCRGDTLTLPENSLSPESLMGWALIVCATGGYLIKLLA
ncbi:hypothetical protein [Parabacteroides sp.]